MPNIWPFKHWNQVPLAFVIARNCEMIQSMHDDGMLIDTAKLKSKHRKSAAGNKTGTPFKNQEAGERNTVKSIKTMTKQQR